jgi:hypothetical protein
MYFSQFWRLRKPKSRCLLRTVLCFQDIAILLQPAEGKNIVSLLCRRKEKRPTELCMKYVL